MSINGNIIRIRGIMTLHHTHTLRLFSIKDGGFWVKLEVLNIPWNESLLDFNTEYFDKAKLLIEKTVSKYIKFYYL